MRNGLGIEWKNIINLQFTVPLNKSKNVELILVQILPEVQEMFVLWKHGYINVLMKKNNFLELIIFMNYLQDSISDAVKH